MANGLLAYVFFALVTRRLGAHRAAPIAVLWTYWGACAAVITFPVQHWIIRSLHDRGERVVGDALRRVVLWVGAFAVVASIVTWLVRQQLFLRDDATFPLLVGFLTLTALLSGVVRGGLAGRDRFVATSIVLAGENLLRVVLAIAVLSVGAGAGVLGAVLVLGGLLGLAWPSAYRFRRSASPSAGAGIAFLGVLATGTLGAQVVLVGGPAVLALMGGRPTQVTSLFVTLALFRAPYLLAVGLSNQVTGSLTRSMVGGDRRRAKRFVAAVSGWSAAGAIVAALGAVHIGPPLVGLIFGQDARPPGWVAGTVSAASVVAVGNLALSLLAIAQGAAGKLTSAWLVALAAAALVLLLRASPLEAVTWAFLVGEAIAYVVLAGWTLRAGRASWRSSRS